MTFPTTVASTLDSNEVFPPRIAKQVNTLTASVLADLTSAGTGRTARAVITSLSGAYGGSTTGTLTASANSAFGTQDGVSTLAAGDNVLLPAGTTNITAASDAGLYTISVLGSGSVKWVLKRVAAWATGAAVPITIDVGGEGTLFGGSVWRSYAAKGKLVDTDDPALYPDEVTQQVTLSNGVKAITNVPIRSATQSSAIATYAGSGTPAGTTVGYQPFAITPGALNTATVTVKSVAAGQSALAGDTAVLNVTITN